MKKYLYLMASALCILQGCSDDDDGGPGNYPNWVSQQTRAAFEQMFPSARDVEWEQRSGYLVADFEENRKDKEAWFDDNGEWFQTETDIVYQELPTSVISSFESSTYSEWRVDDVDHIEQNGMEDLYILDVEQGELEAVLHYSRDGSLIKQFGANGNGNPGGGNGNGGYVPTPPTSSIENYIQEHYPGATIIEIDRESNGDIEVEIRYQNMFWEVVFNRSETWLRTTRDVRVTDLPPAVTNAVSNYTADGYRIDDADWWETPDDNWYQLELESRNGQEIYVRVREDGQVLQ